jgi:hypothetical protein
LNALAGASTAYSAANFASGIEANPGSNPLLSQAASWAFPPNIDITEDAGTFIYPNQNPAFSLFNFLSAEENTGYSLAYSGFKSLLSGYSNNYFNFTNTQTTPYPTSPITNLTSPNIFNINSGNPTGINSTGAFANGFIYGGILSFFK